MRDRDKCYSIAIITILFYDFLLTLPDEVGHVAGASLAGYIVALVKDRMCLAGEEIMGYAGRITCTTFIDGVIVFAVFLAVRSPLQ
jgi:hypothetical protein